MKAFDFKERNDISYYGFNEGPKLKISKAVSIYTKLEKTPFVTLYGAQNWQEDFAETLAAYVYIKVLKRPRTLTVFKSGKPIYQYKIDFSRKLLKSRGVFIKNILVGL